MRNNTTVQAVTFSFNLSQDKTNFYLIIYVIKELHTFVTLNASSVCVYNEPLVNYYEIKINVGEGKK